MKKLVAMLRRHPRTLLVLGMLVSAGLLVTGLVRLVNYTLPMLRGQYHSASQSNVFEWQRQQEEEESSGPLYVKRGWDERALEWTNLKLNEYADWSVGSREHAAYCSGVEEYLKHDYMSAAREFEKAYAACCDTAGQVKPENRQFAAFLQLMIGNSYANFPKPQTDRAIAAYELSLSLVPDNMLTTFNLEKLQNASKGGGKGQNDKDNPQPAGGSRGKRI